MKDTNGGNVLHAAPAAERIESALLELMEGERFGDITVTQVAQRAGVARLTFYRNFESKEAVLESHFERLFGEYAAELEAAGQVGLADALASCIRRWLDNRERLALMARDHLEVLVYPPVVRFTDRMIERYGLAESLTPLQARFIAGGLSMVMLIVGAEGADVDPEAAARELLGMLDLPSRSSLVIGNGSAVPM